MSTGLVPNEVYSVPSNIPQVSDEQFATLANGGAFLGRLQLFTKGDAVNRRLVQPGQYGIPESKEFVHVIGDSVDILPIARRAKAMDMSDSSQIITNYDPESDTFKDIQDRSEGQDSGCMWGVSFLVIERTTGRFLEFYCGSKSSRPEAQKIYAFLPGAESPPRPLTLKSELAQSANKKFSWHVPIVLPCSVPFASMPKPELIRAELTKFLNPTSDEVEASAKDNRRAR